ncbi:peptidoglycan-binding protein [Streptomyces sp. NBC_01551]|uniref:peptidoglycan-binding domain-containing protein n=1 Tax=Streptomyces sp. NBC_01551 TaxID=2975876 RepID=UPI002253C70E|nr:peptidoglycan-binding protein [Streptomyces sp. NBC_01551]MCX4524304.1 peptidoglycan-binding protein [Streptomyces sp. NBC_01551]
MSHHPDESGAVPDDRLLVRPYVAPASRPSAPTAPAWPQSGPAVSSRVPPPAGAPDAASGSGSGSMSDSAPVPAAAGRGRRRPVAVAVCALLGLGAAGALLLLLTGPEEPGPERAVAPPGLSVPALPAGSPGLAEEPSPAASTPRAGAASRAPGASVSPSASASASGGRPAPGASASRSAPVAPPATPAGDGTLGPGDRGPEVRALQERLYGQGFTYVKVNGLYDGHTRRGVAQLQSDRGISGDPQGVYGPATRAAFG